jgi:hypothetical protein
MLIAGSMCFILTILRPAAKALFVAPARIIFAKVKLRCSSTRVTGQ